MSGLQGWRETLASDCGEPWIGAGYGELVRKGTGGGVAQSGPVSTEEQLNRLEAMGQVGPRRLELAGPDLPEAWSNQTHRWVAGTGCGSPPATSY